MFKGKSKKYSKEFKIATVYLMKSGKFKPEEVYKIMDGVDSQAVRRWMDEYDEKGEAAFDDSAAVDQKELKQAQKELEQLKMENEILKKAAAYFSETDKDE